MTIPSLPPNQSKGAGNQPIVVEQSPEIPPTHETFAQVETSQIGGPNVSPTLFTEVPAAAKTGSWLRKPSITLPDKLPAPFGRYELRQRLGSGGMGAVYLAHDSQLGRLVALKIPAWAGQNDPELAQRFFREARAAAALTHANICPVHDVGEVDGVPYLTMAYIDGVPLDQHLRGQSPPTWQEAAELARSVALAMEEAHQNGIIHRDLKPANIVLNRRGEPVVMDFGLAYQADELELSRLTQSGLIMGTPAYMPPEQAGGELDAIGPRSDIYSLGVILYEMLAGQVPFQAATFGKLIAQIERDPPVPPRQLRQDVPAVLEEACLKALEKDPARRHASMSDFAKALQLPFASTIAQHTTAQPAQSSRKKLWIGALAAGLAATVLFGIVLYVATDNGTLEIRLSDPKAEVQIQINDQGVQLRHAGETFWLRAGNHTIEVKGKNFETVTKHFRITRQERKIVEVTLRPRRDIALKSKQDGKDPPTIGPKRPVKNEPAPPNKKVELPPFQKLTAEQADQVKTLVALGNAAGRNNRLPQAVQYATEALAIDPHSVDAYVLRSSAHDAMGRYDKSIEDATTGLQVDPNRVQLLINRTNSYVVLHKYKEAEKDASLMLKIAGTHHKAPRVRANRGVAYAGMGKYKEALADFNMVEPQLPGVALLYWNRSFVHLRLGNHRQAAADRKRAIDIEPAEYKNKSAPDWVKTTAP